MNFIQIVYKVCKVCKVYKVHSPYEPYELDEPLTISTVSSSLLDLNGLEALDPRMTFCYYREVKIKVIIMFELIDKIDKMHMRGKLPSVKTGDKVRVHQKIREGKKERIQVFEGIVIKAVGGKGINSSFTVRKITGGVGVEKTFPMHLPTVVKVEKLKSAKVKRSKIYNVRGIIGKRASRMKNERAASGTWEDVKTEEKLGPVEVPQAELDAMRAAEKAEEKAEEKEEAQEAGEQKSIPDAKVEAPKKEEPEKKPKADNAKTTPNYP